jgi:hypothetical protein
MLQILKSLGVLFSVILITFGSLTWLRNPAQEAPGYWLTLATLVFAETFIWVIVAWPLLDKSNSNNSDAPLRIGLGFVGVIALLAGIAEVVLYLASASYGMILTVGIVTALIIMLGGSFLVSASGRVNKRAMRRESNSQFMGELTSRMDNLLVNVRYEKKHKGVERYLELLADDIKYSPRISCQNCAGIENQIMKDLTVLESAVTASENQTGLTERLIKSIQVNLSTREKLIRDYRVTL